MHLGSHPPIPLWQEGATEIEYCEASETVEIGSMTATATACQIANITSSEVVLAVQLVKRDEQRPLTAQPLQHKLLVLLEAVPLGRRPRVRMIFGHLSSTRWWARHAGMTENVKGLSVPEAVGGVVVVERRIATEVLQSVWDFDTVMPKR
jgi:hypothetical protein